MELCEVDIAAVGPGDEARFRALLEAHHYLGASPKVGATSWYVAHRGGEWLALAAFSAAARKCRARDEWIGWDFRTQHGRLHLIANNARFLILPGRGVPNLGSRVLGLCARRLARDWPARFGHPLLMLETFVDLARFRGTVYRAAGWLAVGRTRGFRRHRSGYVAGSTPKLVFVRPLVPDACRRLAAARLDPELWKKGVPRTMIGAAQQASLYDFFREIDDPRTRKGRRHSLPSVLALATGATLCGMRGWKAISEWVDDLGEKALARFGVRLRDGVRLPPSMSTIRNVAIRVDPDRLDEALRKWHEAHGGHDGALAIDGKTLKGAIDEHGVRAHIMSAVGHETTATLAQKNFS